MLSSNSEINHRVMFLAEGVLTKPQFQSMADVIRRLSRMRGVSFEFESHAEIKMKADNIDRLDVQNALSNCRVIEEQLHDPFWRYVCVGLDTEERKITVVVELEESYFRIIIVTVWK